MRLPFLHKVTVKKITGEASGPDGQQAAAIVQSVLKELPELIAVSVVDIQTSKTLAAYTTLSTFDPYKLSSRHAELLRRTQHLLAAPWLADQQLTDHLTLLDDQIHCLRPTASGRWVCFVAVRTADTNLALAREALRRCTN